MMEGVGGFQIVEVGRMRGRGTTGRKLRRHKCLSVRVDREVVGE